MANPTTSSVRSSRMRWELGDADRPSLEETLWRLGLRLDVLPGRRWGSSGLGFGEVAEDALGDADGPALLGGTGTQAYGLGVYGVDGDALGDAVGPALGLRLVSWPMVEGALGDAGVYGEMRWEMI
eukprot:scaffold86992_cov70-Cyclotella_meneghiniana.AAC.6